MKKVKDSFPLYSFRYIISIIGFELVFLFASYGQVSDFKQYSNPSIESSAIYKESNIYQKDFILFMDMLQKSHPAFALESKSVFGIDSIKQAGYQWAEKCKSPKELWVYMQAITTLLDDSHTTLMPEINMELVYPVMCFFDENNIRVMGINEEYKSYLGKQIELINGYPVNVALSHFKRLISCDNEISFINKMTDFMQLYSMWNYTPLCLPDSTLQLTFTDNTKLSILPVGRNRLNIAWQMPQTTQHETMRKNNRIPFLYTILHEKDLCYLQFNSCIDRSSLRLQYLQGNPNISEKELEEKTSAYPRFDAFLNEMFGMMRKDEIETLVVDVRNNTGGNSKLCDILLSWLKPLKDTKTMSSYIRFSELWKQSYPVLATEYERAFAEIQQPFELGKLYDNRTLSSYLPKLETEKKYEEYFIMNYNDSLIFKGTVIFIQNSKTYSSAGLLITKATDNDIGVVIGDKSSYKPCNYGDLLAWELPHTRIKGYVSHKIFNRPNADKCDEDYLLPAVYLSPSWSDVLDGKDIYWEWILKNYTGN
jgi:hypothetical protein